MGGDDTYKLSLQQYSLATSNGLPRERLALLKALHSFKSDLFKGFTKTYLKCYPIKGFITLLKVLQHSC